MFDFQWHLLFSTLKIKSANDASKGNCCLLKNDMVHIVSFVILQCDNSVENQDDNNDTAINDPDTVHNGFGLWQKFQTK